MRGSKISLGIVIVGWMIAAALCTLIHSAALGWGILIFCIQKFPLPGSLCFAY